MFGGMKDLGSLMKRAREMQSQMEVLRSELERVEITGVAGGNTVSVVLNGTGMMRSVRVDPALLEDGDAGIVEDLVMTAYHDAKNKLDTFVAEKTRAITGGMPIPPSLGQF